MLLLALTANFQSFNVEIKLAHGSPGMFPSDGDAWTENDNATYKVGLFTDDVQFVTEDKKVGNYSLSVNHTSATTFMAFSLDTGSQTNVSSGLCAEPQYSSNLKWKGHFDLRRWKS